MNANKQQDWFLSSEIPNAEPEQARFHVIPVPFGESVSYGTGTEFGPAGIIAASNQLELQSLKCGGIIDSIHTWDMISRMQWESVADYLQRLQSVVMISLGQGAVPVVLGGEHSISFAPIAACAEQFGNFGVVQFDAHADLRREYEGSRFSHACVMRRVADELDIPIVQLGIRSMCAEEKNFVAAHSVRQYSGEELYRRCDPGRNLIPDTFPDNIYVTFDVDAFDPATMPATGTPVPGGIDWYQAMDLLRGIASRRRIVGFDVVELSPIASLHFCEFTAAQLAYNLMGMIQESAQ